ncbi:MAG: hypothetical protein JNL38_34560 [Myxococcales bacterium]|jgi:signal transduction histidine kinase|nr:hypothetical protein [Myxococcales bacterium]
MPERGPSTEELLRQNRALDEQLRRLVKAEQRLIVSQRDLSHQLARFDALNRFAIDLGAAPAPDRILGLAADLVFSLFPYDQCLGFFAVSAEHVALTAVRAVAGREHRSEAKLDEARRARFELSDAAGPPIVGVASAVVAEHSKWSGFLDVAAELYGPLADEATHVLVVPVAGPSAEPMGVLLYRRVTAALGYHEELPTARDLPFLQLFAQQVGAALNNARLMSDLQQSYEMLAQAQRDLVVRERLAAVGELAAVVAHEVRNPVAVIYNSVAALHRLVEGPDTARHLVAIVQEEAQRLNHMVADLLDFARPSAPRLRDESAVDVVRDAVLAVSQMSGSPVAVSVEVEGEIPPLYADARMLRQVLVNLLVNAREASVDAQPVCVRLRAATSAAGRPEIAIEVCDHGSGMTPDRVERLFEPFYTTKARGTGLGLAVVKRFVEAHDGTIDVRSSLGFGTVFSLRLPASSPTA